MSDKLQEPLIKYVGLRGIEVNGVADLYREGG